VGQYGVERQDEAYLRGRAGTRLVQITDGAVADAAEGGSPATQGCDVTLTIDMDLQKAALSSLERNIQCIREERDNGYMETKSDVNFRDADSGAAVAVDVRTGEVLAMVSSPTYDPTIFLRDDAEARQAIADLWQDPLKGALNRAIQGTYTPGSTFKPLTAIAALEEGVINRNTERVDEGVIEFSGMKFRCLEKPYEGHGAQTLKQALEVSCNIFFYQIGVDTTIDNLEKWAKLFGLGVKTGIDLPYEAAGTMSSKAFKLEKQKDIWRPADTAQTSIGQMFNSFTPLQMACYMAALANGGLYYTPYVTKEVTRYDGSPVRKAKPEARRIPVSAESIDAVKEGMVNSTTSIDGTASEAFAGFPFAVAGKTGTAQTGYENQDQSSNSLFVCYAPADDPEIAVAVVIEKGVWGSYTAPVARDILESYFGLTGSASEKAATGDAASALVP
jgi:penicillin-binding protein 2